MQINLIPLTCLIRMYAVCNGSFYSKVFQAFVCQIQKDDAISVLKAAEENILMHWRRKIVQKKQTEIQSKKKKIYTTALVTCFSLSATSFDFTLQFTQQILQLHYGVVYSGTFD
jgi:hypothetical protein